MPALISEVSFFVGNVCWVENLPKGFGVGLVLQSFLLEYKELQLLARIAVVRRYMRPIVTDGVAWSVCRLVSLLVCLSGASTDTDKNGLTE